MLTHCHQYASAFCRGALHGRPRRVRRRVARESADLRGGGDMSFTAALHAADLMKSYAEVATPWGMLRNATPEPRNTHSCPTPLAASGSALSGWFEPYVEGC